MFLSIKYTVIALSDFLEFNVMNIKSTFRSTLNRRIILIKMIQFNIVFRNTGVGSEAEVEVGLKCITTRF